MKRILLLNILLCLVVSLSAQKVISYKGPDGHTVTYRLYEQPATAEVAPPKEDHHKHYEYETLVIPEHVVYKGKNYTVTSLGRGALDDWYDKKARKYAYIKSITLPKTLKSINTDALYSKTEIYISDLDAWCRINRGCFRIDKLYHNGNLVTRVVFPDTERISDWAFYSYKPLESVVIPNSVTSIGSYAFDGTGLTSLKIPNSVKYIDPGAFSGTKIKELVIPNTVIELNRYSGTGAFRYCEELEEVEINMSGEISKGAFSGCSKLKKVIIGPSVTGIAEGAFSDCKVLTNVIIKNNPSLTIEGYAFDGCIALTNVQGLTDKSKVDTNAFAFKKTPSGRNSTPFSFADYKKTFTYYTATKLPVIIEQWQKKAEFETTEQWKARLTESNRNAKVKEVVASLKNEYIANWKAAEPAPELLPYDADKAIFTVRIGSENLYVKVPYNEAQQFKAAFKPESIQTTYDIVNDRLAIVGRTCQLDGKMYPTTNTYAKADNLDYLALNLPPLEMDFGSAFTNAAATQPKAPTDLTIDQNIPTANVTNSNTFAVIIGNENYSLVAKVPYAKNDAQVLAEYCRKTLGLPAKNVRTYGDATYAMMMTAVKDIQDIAKAYNGNINVIFYYAGHGIPDEQEKGAYLLPVDADGRQTNFCYPVSKLYQELGSMNVKSVVVLMDACFSGALRGDGMLMSARSVALKPKVEAPQGKMVVLTAASGDETAYPYEEKGHGMFTYFLLKKLRDTKGNCTLGELSDYIQSNVKQQSVVVNRKSQTPTISSSVSIADSWKGLKLK